MRHLLAFPGSLALATAVLCLGLPLAAIAKDDCLKALVQPQEAPIVINFPPDSAELSTREKRRLEAFLEDPSHTNDLCVIAQSETFGDSEYNEALARKRSKAVVQALQESGLKATAVTLRPGDSREMTYHAMERRILILDTE